MYKTAQRVSKIKHSKKPQRRKPEKIATKNLAGIQEAIKRRTNTKTNGGVKVSSFTQRSIKSSKGNWLKKRRQQNKTRQNKCRVKFLEKELRLVEGTIFLRTENRKTPKEEE